MITLENACSVFIGLPDDVEIGLTNFGVWHFENVVYVSTYTNAPTYLTNIADGAYILADSSGGLLITDGPPLALATVAGFAASVGFVGFLLGMKWIIGHMYSAAGIPRTAAE